MNSLAIITVCYKSDHALRNLSESLNKQTIKPSLWILVDNAPLTNPVSSPKVLFPFNTLLGKEGDGFGEGCNAGIDILHAMNFGGWIWLLNPDTQLSTNNYIEILLGTLNKADPYTILGTAIQNLDHQLEQSAGWICKGLYYRKSQVTSKIVSPEDYRCVEVDWVSGCNLLFKPSSYSFQLRFDDHFPLYFEDIDFCLRAKRLKGHCIWMNSLKIYHQKSTGSKCNPFRREKLKMISQIRFLCRYQPWWVASFHTLRIVFVALLRLPFQFNKSLGVLCGAIKTFRNTRF